MKSRGLFAFTITELLVVIVVLIVLIALLSILFWHTESSRRTTRHPQPLLQERAIHQGLVTFAQSNNTRFPGLDFQGRVLPDGANTYHNGTGATVEARFRILLEAKLIKPEQLIDHQDKRRLWQSGSVFRNHYSYTLPRLTDKGSRRHEWRDTLNTQAPIITERNTGGLTPYKAMSIHASQLGDWRGTVVWNDNHAMFEQTAILTTKHGNSPLVSNDYLFAADSPNDALQIHSGE